MLSAPVDGRPRRRAPGVRPGAAKILAVTDSSQHPRSVRSFVIRAGRTTAAQQRALAELWPQYGLEFTPAPLDQRAVFGRLAPCVLEIGFGNGENLAALAAARPQCDFLGVEVHRPGIGRLLLALQAQGLTNVRVVCHDAVQVVAEQLPAGSLAEVLVLFPDPWPKKRHHKRRLIQREFATLLASRLHAGGLLRLATDWQPYASEMLATLSDIATLANLSADGTFVPRPAERAPTRFERRGERLGHEVWDLAFRRRAT
jgi:tRNA (guanine-N7-)-methyltransferase